MKLKKIMLIPVMCLAIPFNGFAGTVTAPPQRSVENITPQPRYSYISDASLYLDIDGGTASCTFDLTGYSGLTKVTGTMTLYKYSSSGSRIKVKSWSISKSSQYILETRTATVNPDDKLELVFSGKAYSGSSYESFSLSL